MDEEKLLDEVELPVDVSELGELRGAELECPGVYFIVVDTGAEPGSFPVRRGYYLVLEDAPISAEARRYGRPLQSGGGPVVFPDWEERGGRVIEYEIYKYRLSHSLPLPDGESLYECAIYGAECHPEYFGSWPAPLVTPWGRTTRYRTLAVGIYWLETEQCKEALAVFAPVWQAEFSASLKHRASQTEYDREHGITRTLGYLFFPPEVSCVAIFELLQTRPQWVTDGRVDLPALMNAIWENWPEYAVAFNAREQFERGAAFAMWRDAMGIEAKPADPEEYAIKLTPGAGTDFLRW